jgi:hypothetical protein
MDIIPTPPSPFEGEGYQMGANSVLKNCCSQAEEKCPDARPAKSRGMRRTCEYAAVTRDEQNAADGRFSTAC